MIKQLSTLIHDLCFALLTISPTIFVFNVTLLGDAIKNAQEEENAARENDKKSIQDEITKIKEASRLIAQDGDTTKLLEEIKILEGKKALAEKRINDIKTKYSHINFNNTVLYPCLAFFLSLAIGSLMSLENESQSYPWLIILLQLLFFSCGIIKIYKSLVLVQEISANKKESEHYDQLKETYKLALFEYDQSKESDTSVLFPDIDFPLSAKPSTELVIDFTVQLTKGKILKDAYVWFYVDDGLGLVSPSEENSWRQRSDYNPPNIRTVKISLNNLSVGPLTPRTLKLKTPEIAGKYLLRYAVRAEGYFGSIKDLTILVK